MWTSGWRLEAADVETGALGPSAVSETFIWWFHRTPWEARFQEGNHGKLNASLSVFSVVCRKHLRGSCVSCWFGLCCTNRTCLKWSLCTDEHLWIMLQTCVKRIRLDMPVTDSDFVLQTTDDIDEAATVIVTFRSLNDFYACQLCWST